VAEQKQKTVSNTAKDLLQNSFKGMMDKESLTKMASKIDHANDNAGITTIGMPTVSQGFKFYSTGPDVTKAIQKVADQTVIAFNTIQKDARRVNDFVARQLQDQQELINTNTRHIKKINDNLESNTYEINRLKHKLAMLNASSIKGVGIEASNENQYKKNEMVSNNSSGGVGEALSMAALGKMLLKLIPGASIVGGILSLDFLKKEKEKEEREDFYAKKPWLRPGSGDTRDETKSYRFNVEKERREKAEGSFTGRTTQNLEKYFSGKQDLLDNSTAKKGSFEDRFGFDSYGNPQK